VVTPACRVVFERSKCASMGLCEMVAPDIFQLDDDGIMTVRSDVVDASRRAEMESVAMGCPTQSLSVIDA
jgi:ferredoxin